MPARESIPAGAPAWADFASSDLAKTQAFYGALFGWTFLSAGPEYGGYVNAYLDAKMVAGFMGKNPEWNVPDGWTVYFATDDIDATLEKVVAGGGQNCMPPMEVRGLGHMALFGDGSGAMVGLWQPMAHKGFQVAAETGAPVWFELNTRDYARAIEFYTAVLGWDTKVEADSEQFRYTVAERGGEPIAGVNDGTVGEYALPDGVPVHWAVYFGVADADAAASSVVELGGTVLVPPMDTPYGRMLLVQDATGGTLWLCGMASGETV